MTMPMELTYTANQPLCLGGQIYMWNRYWHVGHMVHMVDAQYMINGSHGKTDLLTPDGDRQRLIFPLKNRYMKTIGEIELNLPLKSLKKTISTFDVLYNRFEAYKELKSSFHGVLRESLVEGRRLGDFNLKMFDWIVSVLKLSLQQHVSKDLIGEHPVDPSVWIAAMGCATSCKLYLGGGTAQKAYLQENDFAVHGMTFVPQNFVMAPYRRGSLVASDATVSILDPLFVGGPELVRELISVPAW